MAYTISTHNGHNSARQHNLRNPKVVAKEEHINKDGLHETWLDIEPREAYKRIFDKARRKYNAEQCEKGHPERQISDYYKKICEDKKKHPVYEMIIQVGSYESRPDATICKRILTDFCKSWKERNPNMVMIGAYYHEDELGAPHCHIDYIPVADNLNRGMERQSALVKALNQMGLETTAIHNTAQIQWEREQNRYLEQLCNEHGLEVEHPERDKQKHMDIEEYRQLKKIEELERKNAELQEEKKKLLDKVNSLIDYHNELSDTLDELEAGSVELARNIVTQERNREYIITR